MQNKELASDPFGDTRCGKSFSRFFSMRMIVGCLFSKWMMLLLVLTTLSLLGLYSEINSGRQKEKDVYRELVLRYPGIFGTEMSINEPIECVLVNACVLFGLSNSEILFATHRVQTIGHHHESETAFGDSEFAAVSSSLQVFRHLRTLDLSDTDITDESIDLIREFDYVDIIDLSGTKISKDGKSKLDALGLNIVWRSSRPVRYKDEFDADNN